jgi:regulator of PEP synthase PpsR (kinase-PPPase family)
VLTRGKQVTWVSDLKYVTATALDHMVLHQLSESGEQQEWYVYPMVDHTPGLDIRVYATHETSLIALNEVIPQVTRWLWKHGIEATLDEIQVRSEQAVNDEIKKLIEELRSRGQAHTCDRPRHSSRQQLSHGLRPTPPAIQCWTGCNGLTWGPSGHH